ncbi:MAG: hypothetical protein RL156_1582 [Bacteroidota bacterium]
MKEVVCQTTQLFNIQHIAVIGKSSLLLVEMWKTLQHLLLVKLTRALPSSFSQCIHSAVQHDSQLCHMLIHYALTHSSIVAKVCT